MKKVRERLEAKIKKNGSSGWDYIGFAKSIIFEKK